ncbi:type IV pilus biogenesis protein PilP [Enterobacter hormaechei]|nr:type IV pilus biogenesis protein PilP [Enterobacter hormaechei]EKS6646224.1 type IV pilus biogenesis protein PilP [Enterobacter hormaechei]
MRTVNPARRLALCLLLLSPAVMAAPVTTLPPAPSAAQTPRTTAPLPVPRPVTVMHDSAGQPLNLGSLETIQAETVLFEAKVARARALGELQKSGADTDTAPFFSPAPPAATDAPAVKGAATDTTPPQVVEIAGSGNTLSALLVLSNGTQVRILPGSRVPGTNYTVSRISLNEVVVSAPGRAAMSLTFAG